MKNLTPVAVFFGSKILEQGTSRNLTNDEMREVCKRSVYHPSLVEMLTTVTNELHSFIDAENKRIESTIRSTDLDDPDYNDCQTVYEASKLLATLNDSESN